MKKLKPLLFLALTTAFVIAMNMQFGSAPPAAKFLNPFKGVWQNGEEPLETEWDLNLPGLEAPARVAYDERQVPHIFAENDHDLFYLQGYVTARHRLWQMELQTYAAAGRLSEFFGTRALKADQQARRMGMGYAAEQALTFIEGHPESKAILDAYVDGVNAYINELSYKDLPFEYKLLNYEPEQWTSLKTCLLLKYMARSLTTYSQDIENTYAYQMLGKDKMDLYFPNMPDSIEPIIPTSKPWEFTPVALDTPESYNPPYPDPAKLAIPQTDANPMHGSNNWAVSGAKTASGYPILANDPHLGLNLPSIWYEVQLSAPGVNSYGVSLPGAPNIIIGFNNAVAWGVTNSSRDVFDFYRMTFNEDGQYYYDGKWQEPTYRIEEIKVKGAETVFDTVPYTLHGPVVYDYAYNKEEYPIHLALRWTAHDPSNEMYTFTRLNRAKNYNDYLHAIETYNCPGQNFVFASVANDIAIWQQGKFPAKWKDQGRYLMDGSNPLHQWQAFIPQKHNPHVVNPERGFVSSANQHPASSDYPYLTPGNYEYHRNRIINTKLGEMDKVTPQMMMDLQQDASNLYATEMLPMLLSLTEGQSFEGRAQEIRGKLAEGWDYTQDHEGEKPVLFEVWDEAFMDLLWDGAKTPVVDYLKDTPEWVEKTKILKAPKNFVVSRMMMAGMNTDSAARDSAWQVQWDQYAGYASQALNEAAENITHWEDSTGMTCNWTHYKNTSVRHLVPALTGFSRTDIPVDGNYNCVNACQEKWGPSWRMVVALNPKGPKAYGIYPGGQDGNPFSTHYDEMIDPWASGEYKELLYLDPSDKSNAAITSTLTVNPK